MQTLPSMKHEHLKGKGFFRVERVPMACTISYQHQFF